MVFLGSADCPWANVSELPPLVERTKRVLLGRARSQGWSFHTVAVDVGREQDAGVKYLRGFGRFDELSVGAGWANSTAMRLFADVRARVASTPQVVVLRRMVVEPDPINGPMNLTLSRESVVARMVGLDALRSWLRRGADLDLGAPPLSR